MAKVNKEGGNTDAMFAHQLKKAGQQPDTTKKIELDLGAEELAGHSVFNFQLCEALNSDSSRANCRQILVPQEDSIAMVSDTDAQMLLKIHFREKVNLTKLVFRCDERPNLLADELGAECALGGMGLLGEEQEEDEEDLDPECSCQPPGKVRIFANQDELDFQDLDFYKPAVEVDMTDLHCPPEPSALGRKKQTGKRMQDTSDIVRPSNASYMQTVTLTGPKFQRCSTLQIFITEAKDDADLSFLNHLAIYGVLATDYHTTYR
ncbi:unnamed protein product [Amoebophrya sp. A25]|nr:unnamed protein product [Amoebophrya sp. A25]|eukprot:GSA25T00009502001.1